MAKAAEIYRLSKKFGANSVLDDITFDVEDGEIVVLLGASGSGKTTILRLIAGLDSADSGTVRLHGRDVSDLPARERGVGVIFQSYALFPKMSVEENIAYGLRIRRRSKSEIAQRVDELVALVRLEEHRSKFPSQLSGGQQQRVAIARALAYNPEILLFDEPFSALDAQIRSSLRREIRKLLKRINVPAIFITHDQEEALEIADRVAVLNGGRVEQIAGPHDIYNQPATEYVASFIGTANLLKGTAHFGNFEYETITLKLPVDCETRNGEGATLIFRPEDAFLRHPQNLTQDYHDLCDGWIEELSFVGAFERLTVRLNISEPRSIVVTRPKSETIIFPLSIGAKVHIGLVRYSILGFRR